MTAPASAPAMVHHHKAAPAKKAAPTPAAVPAAASQPINVEFNGSRSDFVAAVVQARGATGVTPIEISKAFAARKIAVSKNLVYNVLSLMNKQKKVRKVGGVYFPLAKSAAKVAAPIVGSATVTAQSATSPAAAAPKKKRRISEEGMRRIIAATKKRWAAVRAAKAKGR